MMRDYTDYLRDILTAIEDAQSFIESLDLDDFLASKEKQYAVVRALDDYRRSGCPNPDRNSCPVSGDTLTRNGRYAQCGHPQLLGR
jgi:hypothetical protein